MSLEIWIAFCAASTLLLIIPGPTIMLVVAHALSQGKRAALPTVVGVGLGDFVAMTASVAGLGVILSTSALLFTILKWAGGLYLIYLGVRLWRAPPQPMDVEATGSTAKSDRALLWHAFVVTALNPKGIVFFVAFLPQFITPGEPLLVQLVILEVTFLALAVLNAAVYALIAGRARRAVRRPTVMRWVNRTGGGVLVGAGLAALAVKRTA